MKSSKTEKRLGATIDNKLNFNEHLGNLSCRVNQKLRPCIGNESIL